MATTTARRKSARDKDEAAGSNTGSQTLMRGLDLVEAVSHETLLLPDLAERVNLSKSTAYRLAMALVDRGYLAVTRGAGYRLGPKLLNLGALAQAQASIVQVARPHLEALAAMTEDTVHLGVLEDGLALYLDKVPGRRRVEISSRIGERQPLTSTGLGKALLLDSAPEVWRDRFDHDAQTGRPVDFDLWRKRMEEYAREGRAYDLEENEDRIRCVSAPIRDARSRIIGAISVSSAAQYMTDERMGDLSGDVRATAQAISREFGWEA